MTIFSPSVYVLCLSARRSWKCAKWTRVDQPVGAGFALGTPTATSQEEIADDFVKFFKNFQQIFGIKKFRIFVTGESYAGRYVPYISAAMLNQNDTEYYDMQGK